VKVDAMKLVHAINQRELNRSSAIPNFQGPSYFAITEHAQPSVDPFDIKLPNPAAVVELDRIGRASFWQIRQHVRCEFECSHGTLKFEDL
jgi:hypothetical protein